MAKVNHRRVKELIAEKRKTITDRQFFSSRILAGHFASIAMAQTRRYKFSRRVKVKLEWKPRNPNLAHAQFENIWINAGNKLVTQKKTREERYDVVAGLFTHELGHVFYTPFPMAQTYTNFFEQFKWYPERPSVSNKDDKKNEAAMWKYCKDKPEKHQAMLQVLHSLHNIVEDGYIEAKMLDRYPGVLGHGLQALRDTMFESGPTLTQMIEEESDGSHIWETIMQLILYYVKWGEMKYGEEPLTDERIQTVFSLLSDFDAALASEDPKDRIRVVNATVLRCWPYINDFLEHCEAAAAATVASGGSATAGGVVAGILAGLAGSSAAAEGDTDSVADGSSSAPLSSMGKRAATSKAAAADDEEEKADAEEDDEKEDEKDAKEEQQETADESDGDDPPEDDLSASREGEESSAQNVTSEEGLRIPYHQTDSLYEPTGGETAHDDDYDGSGYDRSAEDIHQLLEEMAEKEAHTELETERTIALNSIAQNISYGDIHAGCTFTVHRIADVEIEMVDRFREVAPELLHISKLLKRALLQQLQDRQKGGKQTGLMMGRRLEARSLHRKDGRPFYKTNLPNDKPEMAIGLLLDESGSMSCSHRSTYARASAIILHDFCRSLNIPIMVYGHSTGMNGVDLFSYCEFDDIDRDDCFRMMDISSRGGNRDGAALRFVAEQLTKRPEEFKLLILVSDGQPADWGYDGTAAEEDLRGIKHEYNRKGVTFVAAAIGDDKENIKRIYGDSFLDITDLGKLPVKLTEVVKKNIRM